MTIVIKMGNAFDTEGCSVVEGHILKIEEAAYSVRPIIIALTPRGIVKATQQLEHFPDDDFPSRAVPDNGWYYSTHCMPVPMYEDWVKANWGVEWTADLAEIQKTLKVLAKGIRNDLEAEDIARRKKDEQDCRDFVTA